MKRVLLTLIWILTAALIASAQTTTFYYPHILNGVQGVVTWKTTILLTNPASSGTASGSITFTKDNSTLGGAGSPMTLTLTDENGATTTGTGLTFTIPALSTRKLISNGLGPLATGFASVIAMTGMVAGTAIFSEFDNSSNLIGEAGVPSATAVARQAIFVDTQNGYNIGVAYANPGPSAANVTLNLLNSSAGTVASTTQILGSGNHTAGFTFQLFPSAQPMVGTLQIIGDSALVAIALRFDPTLFTSSTPKFTTLPPVTLASLINPAIEWIQERPWLTPLSSIARLLGSLQFRIG